MIEQKVNETETNKSKVRVRRSGRAEAARSVADCCTGRALLAADTNTI